MQLRTFSNSHISFKAMKPNQFKGIDYAVVRKFKAPVETFNSNSNFQDWASLKLQDLMKRTFESKHNDITLDRKFTINKWKKFLQTKGNEWTPAKLLLIFSAMIKGLKPGNNLVPPPIREPILEKSIQELEVVLDKNKDKLFDFNKIYQKNLKKFLLKDLPDDYTGWFVIPSKRKDSKNYEDNLEKLKLISNKAWCTTKTFHAESYLNNGDFHFYFDKGEPKLAVRFNGCSIQEIQGEKNNTTIPKEYVKELRNHIEESKYFLDDDMGYIMDLYEREIDAQLYKL